LLMSDHYNKMIDFSIDIESLSEFNSPSKFNHFLSEDEMKSKNQISLLGKVAVKKAFFKVIGIKEEYKKIEVKKSDSGRPYILIKDEKIKEKLKNKKICVSISHTKDIAVAVCLIYE
jgi:phosphopantetheine--protein transferase-like protein